MNEDIKQALDKAADALEDARVLVQNKRYGGAVNRAYYAYFWLVQGLLLEEDVATKTHNGAQRKFAELYIKTRLIPQTFYEHFVELFQERTAADYESKSDFSEEDLKHFVEYVEDFMAFVKKKYLNQ
jgi:uncharacterized protein (UPF0332 family)